MITPIDKSIVQRRFLEAIEGENLSELARQTGISKGTLYTYRREGSVPGYPQLHALARYLKLPLEWFAGEDPPPAELTAAPASSAVSLAFAPSETPPPPLPGHIHVPLVEGAAAAGPGLYTGPELEGWLTLSLGQVGRRRALAAVRVDPRLGRSMEPTLQPGDLVVFDREDVFSLDYRCIYLVKLEDGDRLKRLRVDGDLITLVSDNALAYPPEVVNTAAEYFRVAGRVILLIRDMLIGEGRR